MNTNKQIIIVGAGFAGLSAACYLASEGYDVLVIDNQEEVGGRNRQMKVTKDDAYFLFDLGPSWYWMPDVFRSFFKRFGKDIPYDLIKLKTQYRIYEKDKILNIQDEESLSDKIKSKSYLSECSDKYNIAMSKFITKSCCAITDFFSFDIFRNIHKLHLHLSHRQLLKSKGFVGSDLTILEWPVLFLGGSPSTIPGLYSLMNHVSIKQGTYVVKGGMPRVTEEMAKLATSLGVKFKMNKTVSSFIMRNSKIEGIRTDDGKIEMCKKLVWCGDYAFGESLLPSSSQHYGPSYWKKRTFSPSSLLYWIGVKDLDLSVLQHHNLWFDESLDDHCDEIYNKPCWPTKPLFYCSVPSLSDPSLCSESHHTIFILIPVATHLENDNNKLRSYYESYCLDKISKRHESLRNIRDHIVWKKSYGPNDFKSDYFAFGNNAYGLANTLSQTAFGKPLCKSPFVSNLYFAGQTTTPGPGMAPCILSGSTVTDLIVRDDRNGWFSKLFDWIQLRCVYFLQKWLF